MLVDNQEILWFILIRTKTIGFDQSLKPKEIYLHWEGCKTFSKMD